MGPRLGRVCVLCICVRREKKIGERARLEARHERMLVQNRHRRVAKTTGGWQCVILAVTRLHFPGVGLDPSERKRGSAAFTVVYMYACVFYVCVCVCVSSSREHCALKSTDTERYIPSDSFRYSRAQLVASAAVARAARNRYGSANNMPFFLVTINFN